jgi:hypothetical protein
MRVFESSLDLTSGFVAQKRPSEPDQGASSPERLPVLVHRDIGF